MRLAALLLLGPALLAAGPAQLPPWADEVVGRYTGTVSNGGRMECHRTELSLEDGHLVGHYWIDDADPFEGTLTGFVPDSATSGHFTWTDRYGTGIEVLVFSSDRSGFAGLWGSSTDDARNPIYGTRGGPPNARMPCPSDRGWARFDCDGHRTQSMRTLPHSASIASWSRTPSPVRRLTPRVWRRSGACRTIWSTGSPRVR